MPRGRRKKDTIETGGEAALALDVVTEEPVESGSVKPVNDLNLSEGQAKLIVFFDPQHEDFLDQAKAYKANVVNVRQVFYEKFCAKFCANKKFPLAINDAMVREALLILRRELDQKYYFQTQRVAVNKFVGMIDSKDGIPRWVESILEQYCPNYFVNMLGIGSYGMWIATGFRWAIEKTELVKRFGKIKTIGVDGFCPEWVDVKFGEGEEYEYIFRKLWEN